MYYRILTERLLVRRHTVVVVVVVTKFVQRTNSSMLESKALV